MTRILFGNTNTNYVSNFYTAKAPDLDKIDSYLKEMQEDLEKEADEVGLTLAARVSLYYFYSLLYRI